MEEHEKIQAAQKFNDKLWMPIIIALSVVIPGVVALLLYMPKEGLAGTLNVSFLPTLNAIINSSVSVLLVLGFVFIRKGNIRAHKTSMFSAFALSTLFLVSYVVYHTFSESTKFGGEGAIRYVYFFILLTHIVLAAAIVPLALITLFRALQERFDRHRKIARWTFPIWLYVSVTGVIVYLMISPYYAH